MRMNQFAELAVLCEPCQARRQGGCMGCVRTRPVCTIDSRDTLRVSTIYVCTEVHLEHS